MSMTILNLMFASLIVAGPILMVRLHHTGRLSDWWIESQRSANRRRRL
jgi:hypothetical protein